MDSEQNETVSGTETETALLMLGAELEWDDEEDGKSSTGFTDTLAIYIVRDSECGWEAWFHGTQAGRERGEAVFPSCTAAKAACERHDKTGQWS